MFAVYTQLVRSVLGQMLRLHNRLLRMRITDLES
jgi:hypothetical protein